MMTLAYLAALAVSFGFVYLWYRTTPAVGSGWAMFAAVVIALSTGGKASPAGDAVTCILAAIGYGGAWFYCRPKQYSGWLLAVAILAALSLLNHIA